MKEKKIEKISSKNEKEKNVRNQAKSCLSKRVVLTDPTTNLSKQLFEDAPTLYLNPTEKMHISNLVVPNSKFLTVLSSGDFVIDASFHGASEILAHVFLCTCGFPPTLLPTSQLSHFVFIASEGRYDFVERRR